MRKSIIDRKRGDKIETTNVVKYKQLMSILNHCCMKKILLLMAGLSFSLFQPLMAQTDSATVHHKSDPDFKLMKLKKVVTLTPAQEQVMREASVVYQQQFDSLAQMDAGQAAVLKYKADKQYQLVLMHTLTEQQQIQYFKALVTPEVAVKTERKMQILRESGNYSEQELAQKQKEIFAYFMAEKVVFLRDKYDVAKQKDNIDRLRQTQPKSVRESHALEKLKAEGKLSNGKIDWQIDNEQ